jgi:hypothetical protein
LKLGKRFLVLLAAVSTIFVGSLTAASPAYAVSCTSPSHSVNGEGSGVMNISANLKVAPYAACGNVASLSKNTVVYYHCWYVNDYGNVWWWVRVAGTSTYGWMSWDNLNDVYLDDNHDGHMDWLSC